jgi:hypothetical protein
MVDMLHYRADQIDDVLCVHRRVYIYVEKVGVLCAGQTQIMPDRALTDGYMPRLRRQGVGVWSRLTICA